MIINDLWSVYRPRFIRSLVYMMQTSEYNARDYMSWIARTRNFANVENRKQLVKTKAAQLLMAGLAAVEVLIILSYAIFFVTSDFELWPKLGILVIIVLFMPYILAYGLALIAFLGQVLVQKPREQAIMVRVRKQLAISTAVKIAVVGSYGKTTFKEILSAVLAKGKLVAATTGNMNTPIGISRFMAGLEGDEDVLIFEMGEYYPGDIKMLSEMTLPDMGVITGINEQHLVRFKTLERTVATIYELADFLGSKLLWVNGESILARDNARPHHRLYSGQGVGEWKVTKAKTSLDGTEFTATKGKMIINAKSGLLGLHQVGPLVAAIDIASHLGLSEKEIEEGLAETKPFQHRMQPAEANGVVTIDDSYNGNPDGARVAIEFLASLNNHRRIYVTPGFSETGAKAAEVHRETGRLLAKAGIEVVALVKNSVTPYIEEGLNEAGFKGELLWYPDGMSSLVALPKLTVSGDVVLLQNDWGDQYA